jgi:hypothetical protein
MPPKVIMSYAFLEPKPGTTHIEIRLVKPKPKDQAFLDHVGAEFAKTITAEIEKLRLMLEGQDGAPAEVDEPMLPAPRRASGPSRPTADDQTKAKAAERGEWARQRPGEVADLSHAPDSIDRPPRGIQGRQPGGRL